jgi:hypothetical protein
VVDRDLLACRLAGGSEPCLNTGGQLDAQSHGWFGSYSILMFLDVDEGGLKIYLYFVLCLSVYFLCIYVGRN